MKYNFTADWFSQHIPAWESVLHLLPEKKMLLEIGCFEGRATTWLMDNVLDIDGTIYCIDRWVDYCGIKSPDNCVYPAMDGVYNRFLDNVQASSEENRRRYKVMKGESYIMLAEMIASGMSDKFDFIYVDGSHTSWDTLTDCTMAWRLLKEGGIMVMDDYLFNFHAFPLRNPKMAIDAFVNCNAEHYDVVFIGYQIALRKKTSIVKYHGIDWLPE